MKRIFAAVLAVLMLMTGALAEETAALIDSEVKDIVEGSLKKARKLLADNRKLLDNMARLLVERETIFSEEVEMLMAGKTPEEIMVFMDENEKTLAESPFERGKKNPVIIKEKPIEEPKAEEPKEELKEQPKVEEPKEDIEKKD